MLKNRLALVFLFLSVTLSAQNLKSPEEFLCYTLGTQFSRHADVVNYFKDVAENSDWVTYQEYGKTNERRPLTYAVVSTPENLGNLEEIRQNNLKNAGLLDGSATPDKTIVWLSYNVHGNEASSTEAAMETVYKLITEKKEWLQNVVVIMDPCVNPDGRDRYANWYNQVKTEPYSIDRAAAEHNEPWPGGRPNHYLFDLNRDWAWASQVETRQRLKVYNQWMPQIHVDFHEQGINEPYYFAPAAEPFHEVITDFQRDFQTEIGKNNAKYFDQNGWLFFTRERFDLLYPSYGDTYPLYMGAIGMTYEQGGNGSAGLGIKTDEGYVLTLVDRVAHHVTTGLATVETASKNVEKLNTEFHKFFSPKDFEYKSYVLKGSPDRLAALATLLDRHEIQYGYTGKGSVRGFNYGQNGKGKMDYESALVISTDQPKSTMVKVLFDANAKLSTPITYDITAWSLPQAYGLEAVASTSLVEANAAVPSRNASATATPDAAGYISKWDSMEDARFLAELIKNDIKVRFTYKPLENDGAKYERGSLVITRSDNAKMPDFDQKLTEIANKFHRDLKSTRTSFATSGPDFGSGDVSIINQPKVGLLKGDGVSSLAFGATWYFFEQDLNYPVLPINTSDLVATDLHDFDILIMPNGYYNAVVDDKSIEKIKNWVQDGGKLIAVDGALKTLAGNDGFGLKENKPKEEKNDSVVKLIPYSDLEKESTKDLITGSIFKTELDTTHPLAFGYGQDYFSLKLGSDSYSYLEDGFNVGYIKEPVNVSGFAGEDALKGLKNSLVFGEQRIGRGSVIYMVDDPLFRAFWQNGKLIFANAIFFVNDNSYTF
ncbi:M14 family metallopeptidase [Flavimarina sp. Hel_I_48]|uniref:M14 family metallopeptidase n=1 Tax=Flavimarina sp. Hel_I_48 TaxID=1392488 RepID=UPI0004DF06CA|nr:M14 family metallopeptidase [Flavimarina sp. Hel_I_48]